jgi:hypothetical protein
MSNEELRLKCLELLQEHGYGTRMWLQEGERLYNFILGKGDIDVNAHSNEE